MTFLSCYSQSVMGTFTWFPMISPEFVTSRVKLPELWRQKSWHDDDDGDILLNKMCSSRFYAVRSEIAANIPGSSI